MKFILHRFGLSSQDAQCSVDRRCTVRHANSARSGEAALAAEEAHFAAAHSFRGKSSGRTWACCILHQNLFCPSLPPSPPPLFCKFLARQDSQQWIFPKSLQVGCIKVNQVTLLRVRVGMCESMPGGGSGGRVLGLSIGFDRHKA